MSLINTMLHDLEERHALAGVQGDKVLHDLHAADERGIDPASGRAVLSKSALLLTAVLICYIGYDYYSEYFPPSPVTGHSAAHPAVLKDTAMPPVNVAQAKPVTSVASDKLEINPKGIELKFSSLNVEPAVVNKIYPEGITDAKSEPATLQPVVVREEVPAPVVGSTVHANRLLHVGLRELAGGASVLVNTSSSPEYDLFVLKRPDRLLVEIKDMNMPAQIVDDVYHNGVVKRLRHTYRGDTALLIFDLEQRVEINSTDIRENPEGGYSLDIELLLPGQEPAVKGSEGDGAALDIALPVSDEANQSDTQVVNKTFRKNESDAVENKLFKDAVTAYRTGDLVHSIALLNQVLTRTPRYLQAREMLTTILLQQGDRQGASRVLSEGISLHPHNTKFIKFYAKLLFDEGHPDNALVYLKQAQPSITEDQEYYALMAAVLQRRKDYLESGEIYRRLVSIDPGKGIWWMGLGISLEGLGRPGEARQAYGNARRDRTLAADVSRYIESRIRNLGG